MVDVDVVVVGSLNLDLVAHAARLPRPGETLLGSSFDEFPGGKGLNQAVAAARCGARVALIGAVGDDHAGRSLRDVVVGEGIDDSLLATIPGVPTGRAMIAVDAAGENSIVVIAGANGFVEIGELPSTRVLLAQLEVNIDAVTTAMRGAHLRGALTLLNPAPACELPGELLAACDIVIPNQHELGLLGGHDALLAHGVSNVVVTRGAEGVEVIGADNVFRVLPYPVSPVDTTGAGDAFCGALACRLALGDELPDALDFAAAAGALATTRHGAVPSQPTAAEVSALRSMGR